MQLSKLRSTNYEMIPKTGLSNIHQRAIQKGSEASFKITSSPDSEFIRNYWHTWLVAINGGRIVVR